ncbi:MAG: hypothetical protein BWZ10_02254 [candidate division BRC1 bacterium ADurb.BinA364]|nr:MAG: hypothetical protein BWZ10_02254 [candidate division BRC1 bacterium ADurb.BinA364]
MALDRRKGLFTAAAPCAVVAAGFLGEAGEVALGPARIECGTAFASISLAALDGLPLERSRRVLVTAVARSENTGQAFLDEKSGGAAPAGVDADTGMTFFHGQNLQLARAGAAPVLAEPVKARIGLRSAHSLRAYALNEKGEKREDLPLDESAGAVRVATDRAKSPWILLEAQGK